MIDIIPIDITYAHFVIHFAAGSEFDTKGADVLQATYKLSKYEIVDRKKSSLNSRSNAIGLSTHHGINKEIDIFAKLAHYHPSQIKLLSMAKCLWYIITVITFSFFRCVRDEER
jgi:hypothetical protein